MLKTSFRAVQSVLIILVILGGLVLGNRAAEAQACSSDNWCWQNPLPQGNTINDIWMLNASFAIAVGPDGTILQHDGSTWNPMMSTMSNVHHAVW